MYDFTFTDEQKMIGETAAQFARDKLYPAFREHEKNRQVAPEIREQFATMGLGAMEVPEGAGGAGLGTLDKVLMLEALARGDASASLALDGMGPALYPLLEMGGARGLEFIEQYDDGNTRGWVIWDTEGRFTYADGYLRGQWPWIPVDQPGLLIVLKEGVAYVLTDGFKTTPVKPLAVHAAGSSELEVDGRVDVCFESQQGYQRTIAKLRCYGSAMLVGVAAAALEYSTDYARDRVVFGKPVAHHQGMAFLIAELATRLQGARLNLWRAASAMEAGGDPGEAAASAYYGAIETASEVGEQSVQIMGGHGYMQDHPVEKWMREARTISQWWGGSVLAVEDMADRVDLLEPSVGFTLPEWPVQAQ